MMAAFAAELTLSEETIACGWARIAQDERDAVPLGVVALAPLGRFEGEAALEIDLLFVAPEAFGRGIGRALLGVASDRAMECGASVLWAAADPHAEGFYRKLGFVRRGATPSAAIAGRLLPRMRYDLRARSSSS